MYVATDRYMQNTCIIMVLCYERHRRDNYIMYTGMYTLCTEIQDRSRVPISYTYICIPTAM